MSKPHAKLTINTQTLSVYLGWPAIERQKKQRVQLDMTISMPSPPTACTSDQLSDTFCYDELIRTIQQYIAKKEFRLLEHLVHEIYQITKSRLPKKSRLDVFVTKKPVIKGLVNGVSFRLID